MKGKYYPAMSGQSGNQATYSQERALRQETGYTGRVGEELRIQIKMSNNRKLVIPLREKQDYWNSEARATQQKLARRQAYLAGAELRERKATQELQDRTAAGEMGRLTLDIGVGKGVRGNSLASPSSLP